MDVKQVLGSGRRARKAAVLGVALVTGLAAGEAISMRTGVAAEADAGLLRMAQADPMRGLGRASNFDEEPSIDDLARSRTRTDRILDGSQAEAGKWPSMAAIFIQRQGEKPFNFCGGTVISERWILTAAHCAAAMKKQSNASFFIREGTNDLNGGSKNDVQVAEIVAHPDYDGSKTLNDVALLRLAGAAKSPRQSLASGPLMGQLVVPDRKGTVIGFGATSEGGDASSQLMQVDVPVVKQNRCQEVYGNDRITNANYCAGYDKGGKDSCQGDSGGPMFVPGRNGEFLQVGVVSWGKGCGRPNLPGVYASVGHFERWIRERVSDADFQVQQGPEKPVVAGTEQALGTVTQGAQTTDKPSQNAQVKVEIVQGPRLKVGQFLDIRVISSVSGRLALFNQDSNGRSYQIFPSKGMPSGQENGAIARIDAGRLLGVPSAKQRQQGFRFQVTPPVGPNRLIALVLPERVKVDDVLGRYADGSDIPNLDQMLAELVDREVRTRGIQAVKVEAPTDRAVSEFEYEIVQ
ncbi:trypsin-like serine protease [Prosthecomicrobium hirschii]|uniref:trypsin-like serine protease n=1 Tax=Prosthecodimorpha hirschii TaxID=665126 RepID=UPI0022202E15|nr:trypsin-like serine protease [Prosthecomicrobium hirschii]MCW1840034.1 trypsin-like serine protease [Prosthecomicrobium hirschii]